MNVYSVEYTDTFGGEMNRYTLQYKPPRQYPGGPARDWIALSVSALAPFTPMEVAAYRRQIAEALTKYRGIAVMPDMVRVRLLVDGEPFMEYER